MKEEVLDYFVLRWQYERTIEIHQKRFIGLEGIYQVFKSVSAVPNADKIFVSLSNYYSKIRNRPRKLELTAYERFTVDPRFESEHPIEILPLDKIFEVYIAESRHLLFEDKDKYINQLITLFYGVPFQVHIRMLGKGAISDLH
ncbi:hypothetical protein [Bacillus sp. SM2101]|uniref:hypothetical protein n=1 Tax=Bacillus sp. SM2101 TaxID=2805366 RepID=UPI001BDF2A28|nr:hypothetical protein [Bacillus sp. SM2101]